jgi:hypothetical protein
MEADAKMCTKINISLELVITAVNVRKSNRKRSVESRYSTTKMSLQAAKERESFDLQYATSFLLAKKYSFLMRRVRL